MRTRRVPIACAIVSFAEPWTEAHFRRTLRDSGHFEVRGITWDGAAAKVDAVHERAVAAVNRR